MSKTKLIERIVFVWSSSIGFVVGVVLAALIFKRMGWWPQSKKYLRIFS